MLLHRGPRCRSEEVFRTWFGSIFDQSNSISRLNTALPAEITSNIREFRAHPAGNPGSIIRKFRSIRRWKASWDPIPRTKWLIGWLGTVHVPRVCSLALLFGCSFAWMSLTSHSVPIFRQNSSNALFYWDFLLQHTNQNLFTIYSHTSELNLHLIYIYTFLLSAQ